MKLSVQELLLVLLIVLIILGPTIFKRLKSTWKNSAKAAKKQIRKR